MVAFTVYTSAVVLLNNNATFAAVGAEASAFTLVALTIVEFTAQYGALAALSLLPHDGIFFSFNLGLSSYLSII
jgi:hypothetical protein